MLNNSGFELKKSVRGTAPFDKFCRGRQGINGGSLAAYEDSSVKIMDLILAHLEAGMSERNALEVPWGSVVTNRDEMHAILLEVHEGLENEGVFAIGAYCVARKE